jgi:hypothetical protein
MSCYIIFSNKDSFIGLKNGFGLVTPTPKFWRWHGKFYRIGSSFMGRRAPLCQFKEFVGLEKGFKVVESRKSINLMGSGLQ